MSEPEAPRSARPAPTSSELRAPATQPVLFGPESPGPVEPLQPASTKRASTKPASTRPALQQVDLAVLVPTWIEHALVESAGQGSTVARLREQVWQCLPKEVRQSSLCLEVGERLSTTLTAMKRSGRLVHDAKTRVWFLSEFEQLRLL